MPHPLRSPSVASFQSLFRNGSIKGKSSSKQQQNGNNGDHCATDSQGLVSILPLSESIGNGSIQHLHMLPPIPVTLQPDSSVLEWISRVQETRPEILIASSPKYFSVSEAALRDIEAGSIKLNSSVSASLLFLRVLNTKIYGLNEKSTYHLGIRVVSDDNRSAISSSSCTSSTKTGDLIDCFLM